MENKKIWHDTIEKPIPNVDIYLSPSDNRPSCCMITTERTDLSMIPGQYAYISDLIATSKALDVARKFYLQKCEQLGVLACPSEDDEKLINKYAHRFRELGQAELDKAINHIMKGGK